MPRAHVYTFAVMMHKQQVIVKTRAITVHRIQYSENFTASFHIRNIPFILPDKAHSGHFPVYKAFQFKAILLLFHHIWHKQRPLHCSIAIFQKIDIPKYLHRIRARRPGFASRNLFPNIPIFHRRKIAEHLLYGIFQIFCMCPARKLVFKSVQRIKDRFVHHAGRLQLQQARPQPLSLFFKAADDILHQDTFVFREAALPLSIIQKPFGHRIKSIWVCASGLSSPAHKLLIFFFLCEIFPLNLSKFYPAKLVYQHMSHLINLLQTQLSSFFFT